MTSEARERTNERVVYLDGHAISEAWVDPIGGIWVPTAPYRALKLRINEVRRFPTASGMVEYCRLQTIRMGPNQARIMFKVEPVP